MSFGVKLANVSLLMPSLGLPKGAAIFIRDAILKYSQVLAFKKERIEGAELEGRVFGGGTNFTNFYAII